MPAASSMTASPVATAVGARVLASVEGPRWFSANPSKAWGEKFFLAYTPFWIAAMGLLMVSGTGQRWGDLGLNLAMLAVLLPLVAVPALIRDERDLGRPWWRTYWFKLNVWIGIYAGVGSYFGSEYFFDVLGMVYNYPQLGWRLDSVLLGSGQQTVPLIMYPSAHFYFVTYHTRRRHRAPPLSHLACLRARAVADRRSGDGVRLRLGGDLLHDRRRDRRAIHLSRPAAHAALGLALLCAYFVVSFPMIYSAR